MKLSLSPRLVRRPTMNPRSLHLTVIVKCRLQANLLCVLGLYHSQVLNILKCT